MRALTTVVIAFGFAVMLAQAALAEETEALTAHTDAQKRENAEVDKAYKAATRGGGEAAATKVDPWATVRPVASDKKPEKKKPRQP
jgi:hypothetical protein